MNDAWRDDDCPLCQGETKNEQVVVDDLASSVGGLHVDPGFSDGTNDGLQSEEPNDGLQSEEPNDDLDDTSVFVGNLPYKIGWFKLRQFFSQFGVVRNVHIVTNYITRKSKGYGFVKFSTCEEAYEAANAPSKKLLFYGRVLRVNLAYNAYRKEDRKHAPTCQCEASVQSETSSHELCPVMESAVPIDKLTDDALICIFSYLTPIERIRVERVCKRWQKCSQTAAKQQKSMKLVKPFKSFGTLTEQFFHKIMSRCSSQLTSLDVSAVSSQMGNNALDIIAKFCKNVEYLNLSGVNGNNKRMEKFTEKCSNIRWLSVVNCWRISEKGFWYLFKNCKKMEHLNCSGNLGFTGKCLAQATPNFRSLHANNCKKLTNEGILNLTRLCPQLESLRLNGCELLTFETVSKLINRLSSLTEVGLGSLPCQDGINQLSRHVVQNFVHPTTITKLELFNCLLTDRSLSLVCGSCPMLSELDISMNQLTDVSVIQLAGLKHLQYLSACHLYKISNTSLLDLVKQGNLRRLLLQSCILLTDELIQIVAECCLRLEELDFSGIPSISENTFSAFNQSSFTESHTSRLVIYTSYNDFNEYIIFESPTISVIGHYRQLYPVQNTFLMDSDDDDLVMAGAFEHVLHNPIHIAPADLLDSDAEDDYYEVHDHPADEYLGNDDPLAEEFWVLS